MTWGAAVRITHSRQTKPRQHRLASIGLGPLLQGLHAAAHTGTLRITRGASVVELLLQNGQPFILRRINDPFLSDVLDVVLDVIFWDEARYSFVANDLPAVFEHPASRGMVRIALPVERLLLLAERRAAAWEPIRQVIRGASTVLQFADGASRRRAIAVCGAPGLLAALDGERSFAEAVAISGVPRVKAGLIVARLLHAGLLEIAREGSALLSIRGMRAG